MDVCNEILKQYYFLEQPFNKLWLECLVPVICKDSFECHNPRWDHKNCSAPCYSSESCRSIDAVELGMAYILYKQLNGECCCNDITFEFSTNGESFYLAPFYVGNLNMPLVYCNNRCFKLAFNDSGVNSAIAVSSTTHITEQSVLYIAMCLALYNQNASKRVDFIKMTLVACFDSFYVYLRDFTNRMKQLDWVINGQTFKAHLQIIYDCLAAYANRENYFVLEDICEVCNSPYFVQNNKQYQLVYGMLSKKLREISSGLRMGAKNIDVLKLSAEKSLVSLMGDLLVIAKNYTVGEYLPLVMCYSPLKTIVERQGVSDYGEIPQVLEKYKIEFDMISKLNKS